MQIRRKKIFNKIDWLMLLRLCLEPLPRDRATANNLFIKKRYFRVRLCSFGRADALWMVVVCSDLHPHC